MSEPINEPIDPGTIPTAKQRIDAALADRYPSVLSLADVEELMERHLAANTEALELRAQGAERERDEARAQAEQYAAEWESLADELPEWEHQHADGETEDQSILERVITTVAEWRREKAKREKAEARVAELERNQPMAPSGQPAATDRELAECAWSLAKAVERRLGQLEALFPTVKEPGAKGLGKIRMLSCREVAEMVCIEREVTSG